MRRTASDRARIYSQGMRKFLIALAIGVLFALILLVAATAQNEGCLPWKTPVTVGGGSSPFSEDRGTKLCK